MRELPFIIVSGLPAAGKTAIGKYVSRKMALPFLDKDDLLEQEFERYESIDLDLRQNLSRECDAAMARTAIAMGSGVLVSFWRPYDQPVSYGTTTEWLECCRTPVIELYCKCDPDIARQRFLGRVRHPGHNDVSRMNSLVHLFPELASFGPLGRWPVVTIETNDLSDVCALGDEAIRRVAAHLDRQD